MKAIIAGTSTATQRDLFNALSGCSFVNSITEVVSGCAPGADTHGEFFAACKDIPVVEFPANWNTHGKAAGPIRNQAMADYADALILVWDGKSRGSRDMLRKARAKGLRVFVWDYVKGCEVTE